MTDYQPYPPLPIPSESDWGEETLIRNNRDNGFLYFVQFNRPNKRDADHMFSIMKWCEMQGWERGEDFKWCGGRFYYELCFRDEQYAMLFKLAHGV